MSSLTDETEDMKETPEKVMKTRRGASDDFYSPKKGRENPIRELRTGFSTDGSGIERPPEDIFTAYPELHFRSTLNTKLLEIGILLSFAIFQRKRTKLN